MPWNVRLLPEPLLVEVTYQGNVTPEELSDSARQVLALARKHATPLILADCTALEGGHSLADLYFLAEQISLDRSGSPIKEAVLLPVLPSAGDRVKFWETTCYNRCVTVQIFGDRQDAIDWLVGGNVVD